MATALARPRGFASSTQVGVEHGHPAALGPARTRLPDDRSRRARRRAAAVDAARQLITSSPSRCILPYEKLRSFDRRPHCMEAPGSERTELLSHPLGLTVRRQRVPSRSLTSTWQTMPSLDDLPVDVVCYILEILHAILGTYEGCVDIPPGKPRTIGPCYYLARRYLEPTRRLMLQRVRCVSVQRTAALLAWLRARPEEARCVRSVHIWGVGRWTGSEPGVGAGVALLRACAAVDELRYEGGMGSLNRIVAGALVNLGRLRVLYVSVSTEDATS